jgi:hypothetical protein
VDFPASASEPSSEPFRESSFSETASISTSHRPQPTGASQAATTRTISPISAVTSAGQVSAQDVDYARQLLTELPEDLHQLAHTSAGAALLVFALIARENNVSAAVLKTLYQPWQFLADSNVDIEKTLARIVRMENKLRMPLLEICSASLKALDAEQKVSFLKSLFDLIKTDKKVSIFEFLCLSFLEQQLSAKTHKPKIRKTLTLNDLTEEIGTILNLVYQAGMPTEMSAKLTAEEALTRLCGQNASIDTHSLNTRSVSNAFEKARDLSPLLKPALIEAVTDLIQSDNRITTQEYETLRVLTSCMECPMPVLMNRNP